jgi:arylsulfatase A-like enzyme
MSRSKKPITLSLLLAIGLALCSAASVQNAAAAERARLPNIVYILADDMGRGDVSALHPSCAWKTPNIDQLAREGTSFIDAHSSSAVCTPSRYSIMTGRYNWRSARKSGVGGGLSPALIEPGRLTVPILLRQNGYTTAMIGKWHLGLNWVRSGDATVGVADDPSDDETPARAPTKTGSIDYSKPFGGGPTACGFDQFLGISASLDMPPYAWLRNDRVDATLPLRSIKASASPAMWRAGLAAEGFAHVDVLPRETEEAVRYIEKQDANKPFFLYLALTAPHTPIVPAADFAGRTHTTGYGDFCVQVDAAVGQVLGALAARGLEENTLVVFTADNGCSPSANFAELSKLHHDPQAGLRGAKADIYEGGHRIPFVVRWPGHVPANRASVELIYQGDLLATCAAIVGAKLPADAGEDSVNLLPVLTGEKLSTALHEAVVHHSINGSFAIRQGPWKLCLCPDSGGWSEPTPGKAPPNAPPFQLFNLENDPAEKANLYSEHPEIAKRLGLLLKSYVLSGRSTPGEPQKNAGGKDWRELGWMKEFD